VSEIKKEMLILKGKKMKAINVLLCVVVMCVVSATSASVVTSAIYSENDHLYYLLTPDTWLNCETEAILLGGHLATVNNSDENTWLLDTFGSAQVREFWIGYNDSATEGTFVWSSGEPQDFENWGINQPDNWANTNEDFTAIIVLEGLYGLHSGTWNDGSNATIHAVVEIVPEPTTLSLLAISSFALMRRRRT